LLSEFRELLSIPEKYRISEIDKYVLNKKIIAELKESFTELKVLKIKKGREVYKIRFEWEVLTVLPPSEEDKKKKEQEEKEKIIEKQSEYEQNLNKKIKKEKLKVSELEFNLKWLSFVKENNLDVQDPNIDIVFKTFSKGFEVEKGDIEVSEEPTPEETISEEPQENRETVDFLSEEEKELILNYRKLQEKSKTLTEIERFNEFGVQDLIDTRYPRQKGYEIYFTDEDLCNELTEEGFKYVDNYIKTNHLEKDILSKTGKELRGLAKINKMIKIFKNHYEENIYIPKC
jgi:hypothetical protein